MFKRKKNKGKVNETASTHVDNNEITLYNNDNSNEDEADIVALEGNDARNDNEGDDEIELIVVADNLNNKFKQYMNEVGVYANEVYDKLEMARDSMLLQMGRYRIVVIESGKGSFTSIAARGELIDMVGMADEEAMISIFYTDEALRSEGRHRLGQKYKSINWHKYSTTADTCNEIYKLHERYSNKNGCSVNIDKQDVRKYTGGRVLSTDVDKMFGYGEKCVDFNEIISWLDNTEDCIKSYEDVI